MLGSLAMYFIGQEASVMKSLARPSFFRLFDLLVSHANPGLKSPRWTFDGVEFERERHSSWLRAQAAALDRRSNPTQRAATPDLVAAGAAPKR